MSDPLKTSRFLVGLLIANVLILMYLPTLRYRGIVIHHTASTTDDLESIRRFHRNRGWSDAAYHLMLSNGSTSVPFGHLEATHRFRYWTPSVSTTQSLCNMSAIHVCIVGNYDVSEVPEDLKPALGYAISTLQHRYGIPDSRVMLHSECNATLCPGRYIAVDDVLTWASDAALRLPEEIREQQLDVIRQPNRILAIWLVGIDLVVLLVVALRPLSRNPFD